MNLVDELTRRGVQPWLAPYFAHLLQVAQYNGLNPRVTSLYRSITRQAQLYEQYKAGKSRYPAAPPGQSYHNYGRAMDMVADRLEDLGAYWQRMGGKWGGVADPIHFAA